MITEDYVSFEIAKLLKEKGFDEETRGYYPIKGDATGRLMFGSEYNHNHSQVQISAPTLQMAMKWLREKCIFITLNIISFNLNDSPVWSFDIWHNNNHEYRSSDYFDSYEQACEETIKYCLKNFIEYCKPYLRSMSSMTEEEENEYRAINCYEGLFPRNEDALDYTLEHHLDFRGLISMGLALEAPKWMY